MIKTKTDAQIMRVQISSRAEEWFKNLNQRQQKTALRFLNQLKNGVPDAAVRVPTSVPNVNLYVAPLGKFRVFIDAYANDAILVADVADATKTALSTTSGTSPEVCD